MHALRNNSLCKKCDLMRGIYAPRENREKLCGEPVFHYREPKLCIKEHRAVIMIRGYSSSPRHLVNLVKDTCRETVWTIALK